MQVEIALYRVDAPNSLTMLRSSPGPWLYPCAPVAPIAPILRSREPRLCALSARLWSTITIPRIESRDPHDGEQHTLLPPCISQIPGQSGRVGQTRAQTNGEREHAAHLEVRHTKPPQEVTAGSVRPAALRGPARQRHWGAPGYGSGSIRFQLWWRAEPGPGHPPCTTSRQPTRSRIGG